MSKTSLTQDQLKTVIHYDPETGVFTWLKRSDGKLTKTAGGPNSNKSGNLYWRIRVYGHQLKAHQLAWLYMTGGWPDKSIDHEDLDGLNNRWSNLRLATNSQNLANTGRNITNKSGYKGVYWDKANNSFRAAIKLLGKRKYLGSFTSAEDAHAAYCAAAQERFGEFARTE